MQNIYDLRIACVFGLILVLINEYLQLIPVFGRTFDYLDIIASFIGALAGYKVFQNIMARQMRTQVNGGLLS